MEREIEFPAEVGSDALLAGISALSDNARKINSVIMILAIIVLSHWSVGP
jgi:hypothetical protein